VLAHIFDHSTVKHALLNTLNDCHQWLSHSFIVHQIRFRPERRPGRTQLGSLQRSPRLPSWINGALLLRRRGRGKREGKKGGDGKRRTGGKLRGEKGKGGEGTAPPPFRKFLDQPLLCVACNECRQVKIDTDAWVVKPSV